LVEVQKDGWLQDNGGTDQTSGAYQQRAEPGDESIGYSQMRCPLSRTIEDHQLVFDENRLRYHRPNPAGPRESNQSNEEMNEEDGKITHPGHRIKAVKCFDSSLFL
jgi:hypothetical protein